jgi:hypothetical protein
MILIGFCVLSTSLVLSIRTQALLIPASFLTFQLNYYR